MKKPWHRANPALFRRIQEEVGAKYPDLGFFVENGTVFVRGSFPVVHDGAILDRYRIELELAADWPNSIPILRETGGRIPLVAGRHMNSADGTACPIVPEEWLVNPHHESLLSFLEEPVHNFFLGQSLVELGEPWPFGERPHYSPGLLECYRELLGSEDESVIRKYLEYLSRKEVKGHWDCPCGGGKRLRNCHLDHLLALRQKISPHVAAQALERVKPPA
jgi:hypothetical protein